MKNETVKTRVKTGATVGGLIFLVAGIVPSFYFGSCGTLVLLQKVMGGTVEPTLFVSAVIDAAMVVGIGTCIACAATVSIVVGGLLGMLTGAIVAVPAAMREKKEGYQMV